MRVQLIRCASRVSGGMVGSDAVGHVVEYIDSRFLYHGAHIVPQCQH